MSKFKAIHYLEQRFRSCALLLHFTCNLARTSHTLPSGSGFLAFAMNQCAKMVDSYKWKMLWIYFNGMIRMDPLPSIVCFARPFGVLVRLKRFSAVVDMIECTDSMWHSPVTVMFSTSWAMAGVSWKGMIMGSICLKKDVHIRIWTEFGELEHSNQWALWREQSCSSRDLGRRSGWAKNDRPMWSRVGSYIERNLQIGRCCKSRLTAEGLRR